MERLHPGVAAVSVNVAGDDSSNEDQGEEREPKEVGKQIKRENAEMDDDVSGEMDAEPEEPAADAGGTQSDQNNMEEDSSKEKEAMSDGSEEFSFPDTTISLSHLQPSR